MRPPVVGSFFLHLSAVDSLDVLTLRNSFAFKKKKHGQCFPSLLLQVGTGLVVPLRLVLLSLNHDFAPL